MIKRLLYWGLSCTLLPAMAACAALPSSRGGQAAWLTGSAPATRPKQTIAAEQAVEPAPPAAKANTLTELAMAWSSGDVQRIRAFYTADAAYVSTAGAIALQRAEPLRLGVFDETFPDRVAEYSGHTMRLVGQPLIVYDKLVGFAFRWEDAVQGYDGVALLRYEGDRILLHTYAVSNEPTPNPPASADTLAAVDVTSLMETWSTGDASAVQDLYHKTDGVFAVFNDEDILLGLRGQVLTPAELAGAYLASEVTTQAGPWGMQASGSPVRFGDFVLFAWNWKAFDYPAGHGVRFLRYDGRRIVEDIRYAIRPWETQGQTFLSGYGGG